MSIRVYPQDGYHQFTLGSLTVTLNAAAFTYSPLTQQSLYERYGYDRRRNTTELAKSFYGYSGASHYEGPPYAAPYEFEWNLQGITEATYYQLLALQDRLLRLKTRVRFVDYLWPLQEDTPRTRAKVGGLLTPYTSGTALFYPVFDIDDFLITEPTPWQQSPSHKSSWACKITAKESNANVPVPISEDVA
jgi:hypothetical protein